VRFDEPLPLACGRSLQLRAVYETYGALNSDAQQRRTDLPRPVRPPPRRGRHTRGRPQARLVGHACIGPGKPIDTRRFFVVSLNNLGGCHGSTGPTTRNPDRDEPWGPDFPQPQVADWVDAQARLADHLGIDCWAAVIGGSLGGMQAMAWSLRYPRAPASLRGIAAALKLSAQNIAFNEIARQAITADPGYAGGHYLKSGTQPVRGLALARMVGHITYLSDDAMAGALRPRAALGEPGRDGQRRRGVPGRELSALPGRRSSPALRRQHLPAHDPGPGSLRPRAAHDGDAAAAFRRDAATTWCCPFPRTGAFPGALPGDRRRADRGAPAGELRGDRGGRGPRRLPAADPALPGGARCLPAAGGSPDAPGPDPHPALDHPRSPGPRPRLRRRRIPVSAARAA
jgi:hypothetical protein